VTTDWTGTVGAGLIGTDELEVELTAFPLDATSLPAKKLALAATIPLTAVFGSLSLLLFWSVEGTTLTSVAVSALSKLSKLESACSVSGDSVKPNPWPTKF
jgi:hypothetical protein